MRISHPSGGKDDDGKGGGKDGGSDAAAVTAIAAFPLI
jgi:hypothetical protein